MIFNMQRWVYCKCFCHCCYAPLLLCAQPYLRTHTYYPTQWTTQKGGYFLLLVIFCNVLLDILCVLNLGAELTLGSQKLILYFCLCNKKSCPYIDKWFLFTSIGRIQAIRGFFMGLKVGKFLKNARFYPLTQWKTLLWPECDLLIKTDIIYLYKNLIFC